MANNIVKYIDCSGDKMSLKVIELACHIAYDKSKENDYNSDMGLAKVLELVGCDASAATKRGWAKITNYTVEDKEHGGTYDMVSIHTLTPYGNLTDVMSEFRKRFPLCEFHCFNEKEEENEVD
jgi:hypothetical protein